MNILDRSPRFLRTFDAVCATVSLVLAWRLQSWVWGATAALSAVLCATGWTVHLQSAMQRLVRTTTLAMLLRGGR